MHVCGFLAARTKSRTHFRRGVSAQCIVDNLSPPHYVLCVISEAAEDLSRPIYAIRFLNPLPPKIYGTKAVMNIWHSKVEYANEFSLGQVWLTAGTYDNNELNTIETGWQVSF
ncbi:hypothetical protein Rs2_24827 [Raphanus sativus]|nr:hypothetical protein Rs2_24827 [Raphanus sativus]